MAAETPKVIRLADQLALQKWVEAVTAVKGLPGRTDPPGVYRPPINPPALFSVEVDGGALEETQEAS